MKSLLLALPAAAAWAAASTPPALVWFQPAEGTIARAAVFHARAAGYTALVRAGGIDFADGVSIQFSGVPPGIEGAMESETAARIGSLAPGGRLRAVPAAASVRFPEVYPGIDVRYRFNAGRLEYDFVIAPSADPSRVRLQVNSPAWIAPSGDLQIGAQVHYAPVAWQARPEGKASLVGVRFLRCGADFCLNLAPYDPRRQVTIDPVIGFATYFGSPQSDSIRVATSDAQGSLYVGGDSWYSEFPTTSPQPVQIVLGPDQKRFSSQFVAKFDPQGALVYAVFLGVFGTMVDLAVDVRGSAYVLTQPRFPPAFPLSEDSWYASPGGYLIFKVNAAGNDLTYVTYAGQSSSVTAMVPDAQGNLFLAGRFPRVTPSPGAFRSERTFANPVDPGVVKLSSGGSRVLASTYLEYFDDTVRRMALDSEGNLIIAGTSTSRGRRTEGALQTNNQGKALLWSDDSGSTWSGDAEGLDPAEIRYFYPHLGQPGAFWALTAAALWLSEDFGRSWRKVFAWEGDPDRSFSQVITVEGHPEFVILIGNRDVLRSDDGGASFVRTSFIGGTHVVVDPANTRNILSISFSNAWYTTDEGGQWNLLSTGGLNVNSFAAIPESPGSFLLLAGSGFYRFSFSSPRFIRVGSAGNLPHSLVRDPGNPRRFFFLNRGNEGIAIESTEDFGASISRVAELPSVYTSGTLVVDPLAVDTYYVLIPGDLVWTRDAGQTWQRYGSLPVPGSASFHLHPTRPGVLALFRGVGADAFVARFSPDLTARLSSTYFGGRGDETVGAMAVTPAGMISIAGTTNSNDLAPRFGADGLFRAGASDAFLVTLSGDGTQSAVFRQWGGNGVEQPSGLAIDAEGNLIVVGTSTSTDFPLTPDALRTTGDTNPYRPTPFLTVFGADGRTRYSTFLGGNSYDFFSGPALLPGGRIWLAGTVTSTNLFTSEDAPVKRPLGFEDIYLMQLDWRP